MSYVCYTGYEDLAAVLPAETDIVFIGAFSETAQLAYALSALYRKSGNRRPSSADRTHAAIRRTLSTLRLRPRIHATSRPSTTCFGSAPRIARVGRAMAAARQPLAATGRPRTLEVHRGDAGQGADDQDCADARELGMPVHVQLLHRFDGRLSAARHGSLRDDLRFLLTKFRHPRVAWHDPNFGVRFDETLRRDRGCRAARPDGFHRREQSVAAVGRPHAAAAEEWIPARSCPGRVMDSLGNKTKTGRVVGMDKVRQVSDHVNMVMRLHRVRADQFRPGLDTDQGDGPFELTKRFVDRPGGVPRLLAAVRLWTGGAAQSGFQRAGRVLPFPHHF